MSDEVRIERLRSADPARQHQPSVDSSRHREQLLMNLTTTPSRRHARHVYLAPLVATCLAFAFFVSRDQAGLTPLQVAPDTPASAAMESSSGSARMWAPIEFRLAPDLDASMGKVSSWRLKTADASAFRAFADRIGVQGDLLEERYGPRPGDVSWRIGDLSGTAAGFFSWSNSRLYESPEMQARMTVSSCPASNTAPSIPCTLPTPAAPSTPPSDAEARSLLAPFYDDVEFTRTYSSDWSHAYTVAYRLGDVLVPDLGSAEVSDLGVLYVSGVFTEFERMGMYPTITSAAAVSRVASHLSTVARAEPVVGCVLPPTDLQESSSVKIQSPPATTPAQPAATSLGSDQDASAPDFAPIACGPEMDVPVRVIELVAVAPSHAPTYDVEGRLWVVPAWVYTDADGATYSAVALTDAYYTTAPGSVLLPAGGSSGVPGVSPTPDLSPATPEAPGAAVPGFDPARYTGVALEEAQRRAAADGFTTRILMLDGEGQMVTADYRSDRLGFTVVDGVVTDVSVG